MAIITEKITAERDDQAEASIPMEQTASAQMSKDIETAVAKAKKRSEGRPDIEEYIRNLVEESLKALSECDDVSLDRQPRLNSRIDDAMGEAGGLTLCDRNCLDYYCHALARSIASDKVALIPLTNCYNPSSFDEEELTFLMKLSLFLEAGLEGVTDKYVGVVTTETQLRDLAAGGPVNQVRGVEGSANSVPDPIGSMQPTDWFWGPLKRMKAHRIDAVIWRYKDANEEGYDLNHLRGDAAGFFQFDEKNLDTIVQLPDETGCWLFVWDSNNNGQTHMVDARIEAAPRVIDVAAQKLWLNRNYTPSYYFENPAAITLAKLETLAKKIQRGTNLNAKSLFKGTLHERKEPISETRSKCLRKGVMYSKNDLHYIENDSIHSNGDIEPWILAEIPAKQERYTVFPEDGPVILIPRNGKAIACFHAMVPTLISNNLLIIRPDSEKIDPEYLCCAMQSKLIRNQIQAIEKPLGKSDLDGLLIPLASRDSMLATVKRNKEVQEDIRHHRIEIERLEAEDPLDYLRQTKRSSESSDLKRDGVIEEQPCR